MKRMVTKGFTLIELMIVVAIIGILAAIAVPNFVKFQCRSKQSEAKTNLKGIYVAEESYRAENDTYVGVSINTSGVATAVSGVKLYTPKGKIFRYSYATGTPTATTFTATATGAVDPVTGDVWTINQDNSLNVGTNQCEQ